MAAHGYTVIDVETTILDQLEHCHAFMPNAIEAMAPAV